MTSPLTEERKYLTVYYVNFQTGEMEKHTLRQRGDYFEGKGIETDSFPCTFVPWASVSEFGTGKDWRIGIYSKTEREARERFIREQMDKLHEARTLLRKVGVSV